MKLHLAKVYNYIYKNTFLLLLLLLHIVQHYHKSPLYIEPLPMGQSHPPRSTKSSHSETLKVLKRWSSTTEYRLSMRDLFCSYSSSDDFAPSSEFSRAQSLWQHAGRHLAGYGRDESRTATAALLRLDEGDVTVGGQVPNNFVEPFAEAEVEKNTVRSSRKLIHT